MVTALPPAVIVRACAPSVAPSTIKRIIQVESGGNPFTVDVNGLRGNGHLHFTSKQAAIKAAKFYIRAGYLVDVGLMQIDSNNIRALGYNINNIFNACNNISAGADLLTRFYAEARRSNRGSQAALAAALSAYNTGNFHSGFQNGYVFKYFRRGAYGVINNVRSESADNAQRATPNEAATTVYERTKSVNTKNSDSVKPIISTSDDDLATPGVMVEHTPEEADDAGAFPETALSEHDAWEANSDLPPVDGTTAVIEAGKLVGQE